jgi:hypothetical protein
MEKTLVEKYVADPLHMRLYQQERAIYEVTEKLEELMRERNVSRAELARLLKKSKGWVTQLLDGQANKTIRTVADVFAVLGFELHCSHRPIQISNSLSSGAISMRAVYPGEQCILSIHQGASAQSLPPAAQAASAVQVL